MRESGPKWSGLCQLLELVKIKDFVQDHFHTLKEAAGHEVPLLVAILTLPVVPVGFYSWH